MERLNQDLDKKQPTIIIAHSLGARLLNNLMKYFELPQSVQSIIFVQADVLRTPRLPEGTYLIHLYSWWDIALITSMVLNRGIPLGLRSTKSTESKSYFLGLYRGWNLHQDLWRDTRYKERLLDNIHT